MVDCKIRFVSRTQQKIIKPLENDVWQKVKKIKKLQNFAIKADLVYLEQQFRVQTFI